MRRNILIGAGAVVVIVVLGVFFWARAIFASGAVRDAVAAEISGAIGQADSALCCPPRWRYQS